MSDPQPWLAYYHTLRHLDRQLGKNTDIQDKFWEWLNDCLHCGEVALQSWSSRNMLQQVLEDRQSGTGVLYGRQSEQ